MANEIERGLKAVFIAHVIVAGIVGLQHLIVPRVWTDLAGIEIAETATWRLIGAALVAFAASSWMAVRAREWAEVRILVAMEIVWSVIAAAVIVWAIVVERLPPLEWLNVTLLVAFAVAFSVFWLRAESG
ncbi:MAG: hypothetical protein ACODAE_06455 [Gemmatimonadota bacterium]